MKIFYANNQFTSSFLQVQAIPTVLAMKNGKVTETFIGLKDDSGLEAFVDKLTLD